MKNTIKMGQKALSLILSIFLLGLLASCAPEAKPEVSYVGTWENYEYLPYIQTYIITDTEITDVGSDCIFTFVDEPVKTIEGYTLFMCKCTKGTPYTPEGQYYAVAVKPDNGTLAISCPIDYANPTEYPEKQIMTLEELKQVYTPDYLIGSNRFTICSRKD